jgi:hypothetical protein
MVMTEAVVSRATPKSLETRRRELQDMFLQEMEEFAEGIGSDVEHEHVEMVEGLGLPKEQAEKLTRELKAQWKKLRQEMGARSIVEPEPESAPEPPAEVAGRGLAVIEPAKPVVADESPEEKAIREMNDKHAVIANLGGKCVIMEWVPSAISEGQKELSYQNFQAFRERYANAYVVVPIPLLELADQVVRGKVRLSAQQMRMLIEMLPYVTPKLSAVGFVRDADTFAARLERATARSDKVRKEPMRLIEDLRGRDPRE